jgi:hypothetical protein
MGRYLDIVERVVRERAERQPASYDRNDINDQSLYDRNDQRPKQPNFGRLCRFDRTLAALERWCPAHVDVADWQQAVEDGRVFVTEWGQQADALGWTPAEVFGLHPAPDKPAANYRRLSRYDTTGLVWLLHGRRVIKMTADSAAIRTTSGGTVEYRKNNKPARLGRERMGAQSPERAPMGDGGRP